MEDIVLKIKDEELKELQGRVNIINQVQLQIGQLETQKHNMLHELVTSQTVLKEIQDKLEKEYGRVSINIADGTYEPIKEDEQQADT
tara:strand:+ start:1876 stop:2136 length:261 start_codon:yes stop_codon:yes gene_type:complete